MKRNRQKQRETDRNREKQTEMDRYGQKGIESNRAGGNGRRSLKRKEKYKSSDTSHVTLQLYRLNWPMGQFKEN